MEDKEYILKGYVARDGVLSHHDMREGKLYFYSEKPERDNFKWIDNAKWYSNGINIRLPREFFPDLTLTDEPLEVVLSVRTI